jgi:hypothetical protein
MLIYCVRTCVPVHSRIVSPNNTCILANVHEIYYLRHMSLADTTGRRKFEIYNNFNLSMKMMKTYVVGVIILSFNVLVCL